MEKCGWWDYTCPGTGGAEYFTIKEWKAILDEMREHGMNALVIITKWMTTGYKSRYSWLDQLEDNSVIASNNKLLCQAIQYAQDIGIEVHIGLVLSLYSIRHFGGESLMASGHQWIANRVADGRIEVGQYDIDNELVRERSRLIVEETLDLFPSIDGLMIELECSELSYPGRKGMYNEWAKKYGYPPFNEIKRSSMKKSVLTRLPVGPWRQYVTYRRAEFMNLVCQWVSDKGFKGELSMCYEIANRPDMPVAPFFDFYAFAERTKSVTAFVYDYTSQHNHLEAMDAAIRQPKSAGLRTYFLGDGMVGDGNSAKYPLREDWKRYMSSANRFNPDGLFFMAMAARNNTGAHGSIYLLNQCGYSDDVEARADFYHLADELLKL